MKYSLQLKIDDPELCQLLEPETLRFERERSTIELVKDSKSTIVKIQARDAVALRATADSIIQLLTIFEKTGKIHGKRD